MNTHKGIWKSLVVVVGLALATAASADDHGVKSRIIQPGEEYAGKTYSELVSKWSDWLAQEPFATNPALDPDGRFCDLNQDGKVWFLASTFSGVATRACDIPGGKAIFISLGGVFLSFAPEFPGAGDPCLSMATTADKVRCDVNNDVPVAPNISMTATLDGVAIQDLFAYRAQSEPGGFTLHVADPSLVTDLGLPAGNRNPAVADGYFLFLKPLKHGQHTLSVRVINADSTERGVDYTLNIGEGDDD